MRAPAVRVEVVDVEMSEGWVEFRRVVRLARSSSSIKRKARYLAPDGLVVGCPLACGCRTLSLSFLGVVLVEPLMLSSAAGAARPFSSSWCMSSAARLCDLSLSFGPYCSALLG